MVLFLIFFFHSLSWFFNCFVFYCVLKIKLNNNYVNYIQRKKKHTNTLRHMHTFKWWTLSLTPELDCNQLSISSLKYIFARIGFFILSNIYFIFVLFYSITKTTAKKIVSAQFFFNFYVEPVYLNKKLQKKKRKLS